MDLIMNNMSKIITSVRRYIDVYKFSEGLKGLYIKLYKKIIKHEYVDNGDANPQSIDGSITIYMNDINKLDQLVKMYTNDIAKNKIQLYDDKIYGIQYSNIDSNEFIKDIGIFNSYTTLNSDVKSILKDINDITDNIKNEIVKNIGLIRGVKNSLLNDEVLSVKEKKQAISVIPKRRYNKEEPSRNDEIITLKMNQLKNNKKYTRRNKEEIHKKISDNIVHEELKGGNYKNNNIRNTMVNDIVDQEGNKDVNNTMINDIVKQELNNMNNYDSRRNTDPILNQKLSSLEKKLENISDIFKQFGIQLKKNKNSLREEKETKDNLVLLPMDIKLTSETNIKENMPTVIDQLNDRRTALIEQEDNNDDNGAFVDDQIKQNLINNEKIKKLKTRVESVTTEQEIKQDKESLYIVESKILPLLLSKDKTIKENPKLNDSIMNELKSMLLKYKNLETKDDNKNKEVVRKEARQKDKKVSILTPKFENKTIETSSMKERAKISVDKELISNNTIKVENNIKSERAKKAKNEEIKNLKSNVTNSYNDDSPRKTKEKITKNDNENTPIKIKDKTIKKESKDKAIKKIPPNNIETTNSPIKVMTDTPPKTQKINKTSLDIIDLIQPTDDEEDKRLNKIKNEKQKNKTNPKNKNNNTDISRGSLFDSLFLEKTMNKLNDQLHFLNQNIYSDLIY